MDSWLYRPFMDPMIKKCIYQVLLEDSAIRVPHLKAVSFTGSSFLQLLHSVLINDLKVGDDMKHYKYKHHKNFNQQEHQYIFWTADSAFVGSVTVFSQDLFKYFTLYLCCLKTHL